MQGIQMEMTRLMVASKEEFSKWIDDPGVHLIDDDVWRKLRKMVGMTEREYEVCRLIFEGKTRNEAALQLGITSRTVRHYMELLHGKLHVTNRVSLVLRLVQLRDFLRDRSEK